MRAQRHLAPVLGLTLLASNGSGQVSRVADLNQVAPRAPTTGQQPDHFFLLDKDTLFMAMDNTGVRDSELWIANPNDPAQTRLVKDIKPGPSGSAPSGFAALPISATEKVVLFGASDGIHGRELWVSDGTTAGTKLVLDLDKRPSRSGVAGPLFGFEGFVYFAGTDGTADGTGLYQTNGTAAGTRLLLPSTANFRPSGARDFVHSGDKMFFVASVVAKDPRDNRAKSIWVRDATSTRFLDNNRVGISEVRSELFSVRAGDKPAVVFAATSSRTNTIEPFISDGTEGNTRMLGDINPNGNSSPFGFVQVEGFGATASEVVFVATPGNGSHEFWITQEFGVPRKLLSVPFKPANVTGSGRFVYWTGPATGGGQTIFRMDPFRRLRAGGGLHEYFNGGQLSRISGLVASGTDQGVAFEARNVHYGTEPHHAGRSRGMRIAGGNRISPLTALARQNGDIQPGKSGSNPGRMHRIVLDGVTHVFFRATDGVTGVQPWMLRNGFVVRLRVTPTGRDSTPDTFAALPAEAGGLAFFSADDGEKGPGAYVTRGTEQTTRRLRDTSTRGDQEIHAAHAFDCYVAMNISNSDIGKELGIFDSTTDELKIFDILRGPSGSCPSNFASIDDTAYMTMESASDGVDLFSTNGSSIVAINIAPGKASSHPGPITPLRSSSGATSLLTPAEAGDGNRELYGVSVSNGPQNAMPTMLRDIRPGPEGSNPDQVTVCGSLAFFTADDGSNGRELWVTDGTSAGTRLVRDIFPGIDGSIPTDLVCIVIDGKPRLIFAADDGSNGREPWISDGTAAGTSLLKDVNPGAAGSEPHTFVDADGTVFFAARDATHGFELHATDGSAATTRMVADANPSGSLLFHDFEMIAIGRGRVLFVGGGTGGLGLLISDGRFIRGVSGQRASDPLGLTRAGDLVLFAANDGFRGFELYKVTLKDLDAAFADTYGDACDGASGRPRIGASGFASIGSTRFAITLDNARGNRGALLLLGRPTKTLLPGGCELLVLPIFTVTTATSGDGRARVPLPIPNDRSVIGALLRTQWGIADSAGKAFGQFALSQAMRFCVGQ